MLHSKIAGMGRNITAQVFKFEEEMEEVERLKYYEIVLSADVRTKGEVKQRL